MKTPRYVVLWGAALWMAAALGAPEKLPMPPHFSVDQDRLAPLQHYPLGVITKLAAFSHHGKASRDITLPNGHEGWVYEVGGATQRQTYELPTGQSETVKEHALKPGYGLRTYTLEFSDTGVVIDVLYNEDGPHNGLSAAALQLGLHGGRPRAGKP